MPQERMSWPAGRSADGGLDLVPLTSPPLLRVPAGAMWLCGKRVVAPDPEAALRRAGASTIVCFQETHEVEREYPEYAAWLREQPPTRGLWYPIPDLTAPSLSEAAEIASVVAGRIVAGEGLILHCAGGIGRAPTMGTLVLMTLGADMAAALAHIAAHRPMAGPEVGAQRDLVEAYATAGAVQ